MTTIDLGTPPRPAASLLDGLPRRVGLTLTELQRAAELAGGSPLPFDEQDVSARTNPLESRLGQSRDSSDAEARRSAVDSLHDAEDSLTRRGLVTDGTLDSALAGAIGLLATPKLAVEIDVVVDGVQATSWHRSASGAVAVLSTADGIVFELAWMPVAQWAEELSRVAVLPQETTLASSQVPDRVEAPFELVDGIGEALANGRADLVPVLVANHGDGVRIDGADAGAAEAIAALGALHDEGHGRLRVLTGAVGKSADSAVGVISWLLVADGWRSLRTAPADGAARLTVTRVEPSDLAAELAPVISEVTA